MRIYQVFDLEPSIIESPDAVPLNDPKGDVVFNNVAFSYDDFAVLKGFNASIKSGQAVAFVGPSGGGKSTLFSLLPRLYDLNGGSITIGGQDITQVRLSDLRQSIAVVTQDILLFDAALKDNLDYGVGEHGQELDSLTALAVAQASDFVTGLENGLQYGVGPRGSKLSGGQKQRIAVARAILRDAPILLLDEATANLDAETERQITKSLLAARKGKTTLIVAHRQASIVDVDQIFVVENGVVAEHGTHEQLSQAKGVYANLFATAEIV
jgi:subfamily B ATP-binding cassette protein MsbA